ncbi:MAG: acyltransferase family protein [Clostridiaceae bacterium]
MEIKLFNEKNFLYIVKAFAVISIVSAHCGLVQSEFSEINQIISRIIRSIGALGVPIFYVVSGFLFSKNKKSFIVFFKSKITSLIIPWILCGSAVYLYVALRKGEVTLSNWILWILNGGYLYYLTVLMIFYLIYFYFYKSKIFIYGSMALSFTSILATSLFLYQLIIPFKIDPYINPLNWMLYFSTGLVIGRNNLLLTVVKFVLRKRRLLILSMLLFFIMLVIAFSDTYLGYWRIFFIPVEFVAFLVVLGFSFILSEKKNNLLTLVGLESYSIYLLHFPIAGIVANLLNRMDLWWTTPFRPIIVIIITMAGIWIYKYLAKKLNVEKLAGILIGSRSL